MTKQEKLRQKNQRYRLNHKDQVRAAKRKWYLANIVKVRQAQKLWRYRNPVNLERARARTRKWNNANPGKMRAMRLKREYNITVEEYNLILASQNGLCAGCKQPAAHFKRSLHVDHDHSKKIVRGLLCWRCNHMLPARRNLKEILENLVTYITDPPATKVLGEERKTRGA